MWSKVWQWRLWNMNSNVAQNNVHVYNSSFSSLTRLCARSYIRFFSVHEIVGWFSIFHQPVGMISWRHIHVEINNQVNWRKMTIPCIVWCPLPPKTVPFFISLAESICSSNPNLYVHFICARRPTWAKHWQMFLVFESKSKLHHVSTNNT